MSALLLVAVVALRAPGLVFGVMDIDETENVAIVRALRAGALLYVDVVEKKPPLTYLFSAPAAWGGWRLWPVQVAAIAWIWATALAIGAAAREWSGRRDVGRAAAWIVVLASAGNTMSVNAEIMLNLPQALALWCYVRRERVPRRANALALGLLCGVASLFKHQAGILVVALGLAELHHRRRDGTVLLATGFALPWLVLVAWYVMRGHVAELVEWNVARNLAYVTATAGGALWPRFLAGVGLCMLLGAPAWWAAAARELPAALRAATGPEDRARFGIAATLLLTAVPVCLGGRFYPHYFLQFVPALALLGAPTAAGWWSSRGTMSGRRRAALATLAFGPALAFSAAAAVRGMLGDLPAQEPHARAAAAWLREHAAPDDTLFVWGHYGPIYYLAQRLPGTRYINASMLLGDFETSMLPPDYEPAAHVSAPDVARTLTDLDARRPQWVVDTSPAGIHGWGRIPMTVVPEVATYVAAHYARVASVEGVDVYRRAE